MRRGPLSSPLHKIGKGKKLEERGLLLKPRATPPLLSSQQSNQQESASSCSKKLLSCPKRYFFIPCPTTMAQAQTHQPCSAIFSLAASGHFLTALLGEGRGLGAFLSYNQTLTCIALTLPKYTRSALGTVTLLLSWLMCWLFFKVSRDFSLHPAKITSRGATNLQNQGRKTARPQRNTRTCRQQSIFSPQHIFLGREEILRFFLFVSHRY